MYGAQIDHRQRARGKTSKSAHDEQEKNLALAIYAETLNVEEASRQTGVPQSTIRGWTQTEEGDARINELRAAIRYKTAYKLVTIATKALAVLDDRLDNGDHKALPNGEIIRVPVTAKDAATIASMAIDKHALVAGTLELGKGIQGALDSIASALGKIGETAGDSAKVVIDQVDNPNPNVTNSEKVG